MSKRVWLYGNIDGDENWGWADDRHNADTAAAIQLMRKTRKLYGDPRNSQWDVSETVKMRGKGRTLYCCIATRGSERHLHGTEVYYCHVIEEDDDRMVLMVPALYMKATVDKHVDYSDEWMWTSLGLWSGTLTVGPCGPRSVAS